MSSALSIIGIVADAETRFVLLDLIRLLRQRHHSTIHLYCNSAQEVEFYTHKNKDGLFASITNASILLRAAHETVADEAEVIATARSYEHKLGCTYNTLAVANRHLGRGYALGGFYHARSRHSEKTSYLQMLHAYNSVLKFWEREIVQKGLTLILNGAGEIARIAKSNKVPYRAFFGSRYKNYHFWARSEFFENSAVRQAYDAIQSSMKDMVDITEPYLLELAHRKRFVKNDSLARLLYKLVYTTMQHVYWRMRGYDKGKSYYLRDWLAYHIRLWTATRRMRGSETRKLADLDGRPFVFFPLHTEPEGSMGQISPEYFYQLSAIAALSRDLPAGVLLAVKETIHGVGRRPKNFYDQILAFKNVIMLDMMEFGLEIVKRAAAVATITGTAGFEAAVMGKPVVTFGRHNVYNFLPHVMVVTDEDRLRDYLKAIIDGKIDLKRARVDGARFLQAIINTSFDMHGYNYVDLCSYGEGAVENAYRGLLASLDDGSDAHSDQKAHSVLAGQESLGSSLCHGVGDDK